MAALAMAIIMTGCNRTATQPDAGVASSVSPDARLGILPGGNGASSVASRSRRTKLDPLAVALAPHTGETATDKEIRQRQEHVRAGRQTDIALERLGWLFVAKARETFDPGYFKIAEQCALALDARQPRCAEGLLLRGHVLQNLHRFQEAEEVAREVATTRGLPFDFGVLGDALMEQGKLDEAVSAYQKMADLRPDSQAATRAAHIRWLKGDLTGAIEMMNLAAGAVDAGDAENAAWIFTRLAGYLFQAGKFDEAQHTCTTALELRTNYPPALLVRGRMLLAQEKYSGAVEPLRIAERQNPLPEYQWALADALTAAGRTPEAREVEARLTRSGAATDPRSFALYLSTRGENLATALRLAQEELVTRADVFTHDSVAWAHLAKGDVAAAQQSIERALSAGTEDARLYFHAAVIAKRAGQSERAENYFKKSHALRHLLLPSERNQLHRVTSVSSEVKSDSGTRLPPVLTETPRQDARASIVPKKQCSDAGTRL